MNFIALLLALGCERLLAAQRLLREPGWLLGYVRGALRLAARRSGRALDLAIAALVLLPALLVATLVYVLGGSLHGLVSVLLAATVLFFALGPRDLWQEAGAYLAAEARGDAEATARLAGAILDHDARQRRGAGLESVAEAVFVQSNNRLFGVVFWFPILGPAGALTFRISDLTRREAILRAERADVPPGAVSLSQACQRLHGVIAWLPARLLALSFGLAGSFEESFAGWRGYLHSESDHFFDANDRLLVHAGRGALGSAFADAPDEAARVRAALGLAQRALLVWLAAFALATVVAWIS